VSGISDDTFLRRRSRKAVSPSSNSYTWFTSGRVQIPVLATVARKGQKLLVEHIIVYYSEVQKHNTD
jgi:hypothetical protein